jgi:RNA polymerase sigma-70 factor (ECF subfamily)
MADRSPAHDPFPSTRWSRVVAAGDAQNPERRRDLDHLARDYWRPIRAWLQTSCGVPADQADDLAQEFFVRAIEADTIARADRARGSFRSFLKAALRNFAVDHKRRALAQKRGGGRAPSSLDGEPEPASSTAAPDEALDAAWRVALLQRALAALRGELEAAGKGVHWAVFEAYFIGGEPDLDYRKLAERHGVTATTVSNHLMHCKRRFRALLQEAVAETVDGEADLAAELAWLFAGVKC